MTSRWKPSSEASPQEALGYFKRVAEADPEDPSAAYYLAQCLAQLSDHEQAYQWYRRAMGLFTQDGETVGPLPTTGWGSPHRDQLHARYNTRFQDGR
jgi:tetratricopeptide (TPR) repeat protein